VDGFTGKLTKVLICCNIIYEGREYGRILRVRGERHPIAVSELECASYLPTKLLYHVS
jgi:hypothetical protein